MAEAADAKKHQEELADEALRVKNFLEDYWQFNEIDLKGQHSSPSDLVRAQYSVPGSSVKRYVCGYAPGYHCFESCVSACKVSAPSPSHHPTCSLSGNSNASRRTCTLKMPA
jgi:hypothetical protein